MSSLHYLFHSLIIRTASILQTSNPQRCFATFIELQVDNSLFQLMITFESSTLGRCLVYECDSSAKDDVSDCQLMSTLSPLKLPTVSTSMLGGSNKQWPCTKVWLQQLPIPALEAWFTSHRSSQRLGDHFALCIEYVLRHSPHVEVQQLHTSQQVLQMVTEPIRSSKTLKALESKLNLSSSSLSVASMLVGPVSDDLQSSISPCVVPLQDKQQQVSAKSAPTSLDESIELLESMELTNKNSRMVGNTIQEKVGKRRRKLLKKLERIRLRKGKTTTIGEFDFLFELPSVHSQLEPTGDASKGKEFHHWEVSVKYLLYAGPWEVFGVQTPIYAAWRNSDTEDTNPKLDSSSRRNLDMGFSEGTLSRSEEDRCQDNASEDNKQLFVEDLDEARWTVQDSPREVDNFLGSFLGPHVGETLLDRKARLVNQLALSANPCAALMLRDLYIDKGPDDSSNCLDELRDERLQTVDSDKISKERSIEGLTGIPPVSIQMLDLSVVEGGVSTAAERTPQSETMKDSEAENSEGIKNLTIVPSALLKGYLFYEYKLWRYLETQGLRKTVPSAPLISDMEQNEPPEKASLSTNHWIGWWTRDIMEFADLPLHKHSKWYIIPKLEWLSPVVIPRSDAARCAHVLSLSDFVTTAAQVADEAARLHMPRKRRFLVAEVCWTDNWDPCLESVSSPGLASASGEGVPPMGAWLEVSRGFVVEDTWPVSKLYRPHGYVVSWSPSLQRQPSNVMDI